MNKVAVISKGSGQAKSFERVAISYIEKNDLPINWVFAIHNEIDEIILDKEIEVVLLTPELMLVEEKIKTKLDSVNIPYITLKSVDFGLKKMEKIIPQIEPYLK